VAPGRDELVIFNQDGDVRDLSGSLLSCISDKDILEIEPRPGRATFWEGSGVLLVPTAEGIATVTCVIDGVPTNDSYQVIISPQNLIQILVAEAGTQLADEATEDDGFVALTSRSPTGDAIAAVIRNRTALIEESGDPSLFNASNDLFYEDPVASYYNAVITADGQFSPTNALDPNYLVFNEAEDRNFVEDDWRSAYDQAVLTSAGVFSNETKDPTGGAFAFKSPDASEWVVIKDALASSAATLPGGCGVSDSNFPAFAPVQIVVLKSVWTYEDGRTAFIFIRKLEGGEAAVINLP
jgi:hypothetical protein